MIGIQLLRVANPTVATVNGIGAGQSFVFPEGQVGAIQTDQAGFRAPSTSGPAGSVAGVKAKILAATANPNGTWATYTAASNLILELGYLDNDGYFSVFLSSQA